MGQLIWWLAVVFPAAVSSIAGTYELFLSCFWEGGRMIQSLRLLQQRLEWDHTPQMGQGLHLKCVLYPRHQSHVEFYHPKKRCPRLLDSRQLCPVWFRVWKFSCIPCGKITIRTTYLTPDLVVNTDGRRITIRINPQRPAPQSFSSPEANNLLSNSAFLQRCHWLRLHLSERTHQDLVSNGLGSKPSHPLPGEAAGCSEWSPSPYCNSWFPS